MIYKNNNYNNYLRMNYDFKENWDDVILPLLSHPSIKKSIKKGINSFLKEFDIESEYNQNKCPAEYSTNDSWINYIDDYEEKLIDKFLKTGFIKECPIFEDGVELYECPQYVEYENYKDKIINPFIEHHKKTSLRAYQIFGACHWWNPTFGLSLAKLIYPNQQWKVKSGEYHTTIVNLDNTLVFDILFFDENDNTKGGSSAIEDSNKKL